MTGRTVEQEALLAAAQQWPGDGVPDNPRAWLTAVAARRLADRRRSISRAKQRIRSPGVPFALPSADEPPTGCARCCGCST